MAFQTPKFNLWCQVWSNNWPPLFRTQRRGWSRCQVRGPTSHVGDLDNTANFEVLFPKWSDVRGRAQSPFDCFDWINVAGWGNHWCYVSHVMDKGAGFTNEYRIAMVYWVDHGPLNDTYVCGSVEPTLQPPAGYVPLPLVDPQAGWPADPPP